jgi:copper chaperone CopZ
MRQKLLLLIVLSLLFCGVGCNTTGRELVIESGEGTEDRVYEVFGMDCPGCHGGVEKLVKKIPAVAQAQANWVQKRLTVAVKQGATLDDEDIYDAIRRANFTPGERIK